MVKISTSELSGPALDYATRHALNGRAPLDYVPSRDNFSSCWNKAGPIIDAERITLAAEGDPGRPVWVCSLSYSKEVMFSTGLARRFCSMRGPSPLVAAMRCYVASKLGDVVEVPAVLVGA